jgi:hypothetical protein
MKIASAIPSHDSLSANLNTNKIIKMIILNSDNISIMQEWKSKFCLSPLFIFEAFHLKEAKNTTLVFVCALQNQKSAAALS